MAHSSRRHFLKTGLAATAIARMGGIAAASPVKRTATDWVTLGRSKVKVSRLAFGTGTYSGRAQRALGQEGFTKLVRYAYDRGIRFFETAESYPNMPQMLAEALKGLPRESYALMTKYSTPPHGPDPAEKIDAFRKQLNSDYIDILLMHCLRQPTWPTDYAALQDGISEAQSKKVVMAHGASVHGLPALRKFPGNQWLDIAMIRMNHKGVHMDIDNAVEDGSLGIVDEVVRHTKEVHAQGMGVISMKLVGEGTFTNIEDRRAALKFAMDIGSVDAVTLGFKSPAEIDEAIDNLNMALA